jgi:hypothetical protein
VKRKSNIPSTIEFILGPTPAVSTRNATAFEETFDGLAALFKPRDVIEWLLVRDAAYYACQIRCWRELAAAIIVTAKKKSAMPSFGLPGGEKMPEEMRAPLESAHAFADWIGPYERAQDCVGTVEQRFRDALRHLGEYRQAGGLRDVLLAPQNKTIEGLLAPELAPTAIEDGTSSQTSVTHLNSTELDLGGAEGEGYPDSKENG